MDKVVTINLNGRAYQLEEAAYDALRAYLSDGESRLTNDPDKSEIIADLEQAVAEKCDKVLSPNKSVVSDDEVKKIIEEMGPVVGESKFESSDSSSKQSADATPFKRLYLLREGAVFAGVCAGLAAYFDVDVTIVRVIFVALTVVTGGAWIALYIALAIIIPYAQTGEERAQAYGETFTAQDIVDRAKERIEESVKRFTGTAQGWHDAHIEKNWKQYARSERRYWKHQAKQWRRQYRDQYQYHHPNPAIGWLIGALGLLWILALLSLVSSGAIFGWALPAGIPIWIGVIALFLIYQAVTGPMRGSYHQAQSANGQYHYSGWEGVADGLTVFFLVIAFCWAFVYVPQVHVFTLNLPQEIKTAAIAFKNWIHSL